MENLKKSVHNLFESCHGASKVESDKAFAILAGENDPSAFLVVENLKKPVHDLFKSCHGAS